MVGRTRRNQHGPHGRFRHRHHRRRHQRRGDRARRGRPRHARAAGRAERPRLRHLVGLDQADPRRVALSRARTAPPGARGVARARGDAAHGAAPDLAAPLRAAASRRAAPGLAAPPRPVCIRPPGRTRDPARNASSQSHRWPDRPAAQAAVPPGLRVFRLLRRRFAPRGAQRARCGRAGRGGAHAHALRARRPAGSRLAAGAQCPRPARGGDRACAGQRHRPVDPPGERDGAAIADAGAGPPGQGQPYRGAAACSPTTAPTSSRTPTAASSSPSPTSRISP